MQTALSRFRVLFNSISTSVGHLMSKRLDCLLCGFFLGGGVWIFIVVFDYVWSDFNEKVYFIRFCLFFLRKLKMPCGLVFLKSPLNYLSGSILGEFVWNCHSLRDCVWLWGVLCTLSILECLLFLGVSRWCRCGQCEVWKVSPLLFCFFCSLPATYLWYLVYGEVCCVFDCRMIFAI